MLTQPVIQILEKRHAVLREDYDCGEFIIPKGFQFDGATMPTWTWSLMQLEPFGRICAAALPHDLLYVTLGVVWGKDGNHLRYTEIQADEMFYERAKQCDLNWLQARLVRRAVILFGDYDLDRTSCVYQWNKDWLLSYTQGDLNGIFKSN